MTLELQGGPAQVHGVPQIVDEILYNLCDNAVVYNRPGGKVCVTVADTDEGARVTVEDTGIGIPRRSRVVCLSGSTGRTRAIPPAEQGWGCPSSSTAPRIWAPR